MLVILFCSIALKMRIAPFKKMLMELVSTVCCSKWLLFCSLYVQLFQ